MQDYILEVTDSSITFLRGCIFHYTLLTNQNFEMFQTSYSTIQKHTALCVAIFRHQNTIEVF